MRQYPLTGLVEREKDENRQDRTNVRRSAMQYSAAMDANILVLSEVNTGRPRVLSRLISRTFDEIVIACTGVCDDKSEDSVLVEDDSVGAGAAAGVHLVAAQDGELIPRARDADVESLAVVKLVRVVVGAHGLSLLVVRVALVDGGVDVGLPVAGRATGVDAGFSFGHHIKISWEGKHRAESEEA